MCKLLGVSSSGSYAWVTRRTETDDTLVAAIRTAHEASHGIYGAPRIHAELTAKGIQVGRKRVARLMSRGGLAGVCRRKFVVTTAPHRADLPEAYVKLAPWEFSILICGEQEAKPARCVGRRYARRKHRVR